MNVRQAALLLIVSVGLLSFNTLHAQQVSIKGPKNNSADVSGNTYGPITPSDTLWRIAGRYRLNSEMTIYQVMHAIYMLNPDAFENQNFNYLVDGAILNLPSERYIARVDAEKAQQKALQDEAAWRAALGDPSLLNQETVKPNNPASKDDLSETKQVIEEKLSALDAEQNRQFSAIRQQFAESITSVQNLLADNRQLIQRLDGVDEEIANLRGRVDDELQTQMDQMLALQNELLAISREAEAQRQAEQNKNSFAWLTDPIFLFALTFLLAISLLGAFAMWLIRRNKTQTSSESDGVGEYDASLLEQSDEMDDLSDALTSELSGELDDDDDDLFGEDDILDDVLSDELQESLDDALDEEFETFDDLDDDSLDPIIEEATDALDEGDGLLAQDDLDNLFDEEQDEELLAEIDDSLDDVLSGDDSFDLSDNADEELDNLLDSIEDDLPSAEQPTVSADEEQKSAISEATATEASAEEVETSTELESEAGTVTKPLVDDEAEKPEISIDELLEQPEKELPEIVQAAESEELSEEMLQNLDKEIENQNRQLDVIADELLMEIEQLEQMGDLLDDDDEAIDEPMPMSSQTQHAIQELDAVSEDMGEELDDELFDGDTQDLDALLAAEQDTANLDEESAEDETTLADDDDDKEVDIDALLDESLNAVADDVDAKQTQDDDALDSPEEDLDIDIDIDEVLTDQQVVEKSADELLAELEDDAAEEQDETPTDSLTSDLDQALADFENEFEQTEGQADESDFVESDEEDDLPPVSDLQEEQEPEELTVEEQESSDIDELVNEIDELETDSDEAQFEIQTDENTSSDEELDSPAKELLLDDDIPSLDDYDSLSSDSGTSKKDEFDDAELEEALKAFDESGELEMEDVDEESVSNTNVELDDLPGLGDWLSESEQQDVEAIEELENKSFEELLDDIEDDSSETIEKKLAIDNDDLDIEALLTDPEESQKKESESSLSVSDEAEEDSDGFLDVDALLNESDDDAPSAADNKLNLDAAFESYAGLDAMGELVDVDGDNGIGAKLDLVQAYIETEEFDEAKALLNEIISSGNEEQQAEARALLEQLK